MNALSALHAIEINGEPAPGDAFAAGIAPAVLHPVVLAAGAVPMTLFTPGMSTAVTSGGATMGGEDAGLSAAGPARPHAFLPAAGTGGPHRMHAARPTRDLRAVRPRRTPFLEAMP